MLPDTSILSGVVKKKRLELLEKNGLLKRKFTAISLLLPQDHSSIRTTSKEVIWFLGNNYGLSLSGCHLTCVGHAARWRRLKGKKIN